jgi:hypothetical protein
MKKTLSPIEAKTFNKICSLKEDNTATKDFWMLLNEDSVTITAQRSGEDVTAQINIPRKDFNKFVKWYTKEQITVNP